MRAKHASLSRTLLFSGVAATAMSTMLAVPAYAQEQVDSLDAATEEIFVTGSLIARDPNAAAPVPVRAVTADDLRLSGASNVSETLRTLPALSASVSAEGSIDSVFADGDTDQVGGANLNLRGLGVERTLVLVDGRRHVAGFPDQQAVDIGSIPAALIERVEVLTGGASAIYGADAVSGAVNFIMKQDFEGLDLNVEGGISDQGDGERYRINGVYGKNFGDGRGNVTVTAYYNKQNDILFGDRDFSRNNGVDDVVPNPALRFQLGDVSAETTPNLAQFLDFPRGSSIPSQAEFIADYTDEFGVAPNLTPQEIALFQRADGAPRFAIVNDPRFIISSSRGIINPGNFDDGGLDLDGNGVNDCGDSFQGFQGIGCWVVNDDGSVRPYRDGLIGGPFSTGSGGDGIENDFDEELLIPDRVEYGAQINLRYDFTPSITGFLEAKYTRNEVEFGTPLNTFYDTMTIFSENPFIPAELQDLADNSPLSLDNDPSRTGLYVTRDPIDMTRRLEENTRETYRFVGGIEGEFDNGWTYEVSGNYGKFEQTRLQANEVLLDRYLAAIDVVSDPETGEPICRSDIDPTARARGSATGFPFINNFGYLTFTPGDGQCKPLNILGGPNSSSAEARDFILYDAINTFELEQTVFRAFLSGDTGDLFETQAGTVKWVIGAEYRKEEALSTFDDLQKGILPIDAFIPDSDESDDIDDSETIAAGTLVADVDRLGQNSLVFDPDDLVRDSGGSYDVWDLFLEVDIPILEGLPFAEYLGIGGAVRYSDYSTIGSATTYGINGSWSPIESLRFRASYAKSVRAPNIFELFAPDQGETFNQDIEPCEASTIAGLRAAGDPIAETRAANCAADGIPADFVNPVTARFNGVTSGNLDLMEETSTTYTIGLVFQPTWLSGLTVSVDYWNIEIEDAIDAVSGADIVENCYDAANFPNQFCELFTRRDDFGLNFIRQSEINFGRLVTSGVDFSGTYSFDTGNIGWTLNTNWTYVNELDEFFDPADPTAVDPELGEIQRPKWSGNFRVTADYEDLTVSYNMLYGGRQGLRDVEIELLDSEFGPAGITSSYTVHQISANYQINDMFSVYGGIDNLADRKPFITEQAYPVSPLGRYFFLGVTANIF